MLPWSGHWLLATISSHHSELSQISWNQNRHQSKTHLFIWIVLFWPIKFYILYLKWYFVNFKQLDNESLSSITFSYLGTSWNYMNYQLLLWIWIQIVCVQALASISFHQCNCHRAGLGRIIREGRPEAGCWGQAASSRPAPPVRLSLAKWQAGLISAVPSTNWMSGLEAN